MGATYLALLRGINVGGKNKLPMKDLLEIFVEAGCRDALGYIQSGNVIFNADPSVVASLAGVISAQIAGRFSYRVPVVLRTAEQIGEVIRNNPFVEAGADEATLHILFLLELPPADSVDGLDPDRSPPDAFSVRGREVYLRLPNGAGRTKLTNAYFDAKLSTTSTGRNWRTVKTLFELMQG
ncbi:MAG: DUF1697 domain-containing protein [Dehalococcoidia bacterium]